MLNLHCNNNDKKKKTRTQNNMRLPGFEPGIHGFISNPGCMGSKSTKVSTTLWRPMQFTDKNDQHMLKL